jgi:hypothetical protein
VKAQKPLEPKDFPIEADETKITKSDGEPIGDAENKEIFAIGPTAIVLAKRKIGGRSPMSELPVRRRLKRPRPWRREATKAVGNVPAWGVNALCYCSARRRW